MQENAVELSALAAEVAWLKGQLGVGGEGNPREEGVEIHQCPAPRSPVLEEVRGCEGCEVSGNQALWMNQWNRRNRKCGACWRAQRKEWAAKDAAWWRREEDRKKQVQKAQGGG